MFKTTKQYSDQVFSVPEQKGARHSNVSDREFVKLWLDCTTTKEIADKLGASVGQRASWLRRKGVNLPKRQKNDYNSVEALNKLIERHSNG